VLAKREFCVSIILCSVIRKEAEWRCTSVNSSLRKANGRDIKAERTDVAIGLRGISREGNLYKNYQAA
jgi:hypothetical protein